MMRYGLNQPFSKAYSRSSTREPCFVCGALAVIPGDPTLPAHIRDYILVHFTVDDVECPMSEMQRELDTLLALDLSLMDGQDYEWDSDAPLE